MRGTKAPPTKSSSDKSGPSFLQLLSHMYPVHTCLDLFLIGLERRCVRPSHEAFLSNQVPNLCLEAPPFGNKIIGSVKILVMFLNHVL